MINLAGKDRALLGSTSSSPANEGRPANRDRFGREVTVADLEYRPNRSRLKLPPFFAIKSISGVTSDE